MDTIGSTSTNKPMAQQSQDMADNAADQAQGAIRSTQRTADQALDRLDPVEVSPAAQLTIYRLVQEALTNVVKYAKATEVVVTLTAPAGGGALVSVRDNGIGFDTDLPRLQRHGLLGMRYRVEAEGGTMRLSSKPGQGTVIEATLPTQHASNDGPGDPDGRDRKSVV